MLGSEDWLRLVKRPDIPMITLSLAVRFFISIDDGGIEEEGRKEEGRERGGKMGWVLG